eukprot:TRINITY_DN65244_c0_g1_i1.p1 TRINITY_DN65244_c0_g1~~TRINITY_DN65244_c0_g1_i1.p1  ORF type:complete len:731 (+),score=228.17 TRINITY_DN65244_c0_g1_i1:118-2310(+)
MKRGASPQGPAGPEQGPKHPRLEEEPEEAPIGNNAVRPGMAAGMQPSQEDIQGDEVDPDEDTKPEGTVGHPAPPQPTPQVPAAPRGEDDVAQDAAFVQAAEAYTTFAHQAEAQARAAKEAAAHYQRLTGVDAGGELTLSAGGVPADPEKAPRNVKVLLPSSGKFDEMDVMWETIGAVEGRKSEVYYGTDPASLRLWESGDVRHDDKADKNIHTVTFHKLTPGTRYYFMVGDPSTGFSQVFRFRTEGLTNREIKEKAGDRPPPPAVSGGIHMQQRTGGRGAGTISSMPQHQPGAFGFGGILGGMPMFPGGGPMPAQRAPIIAEERRIDPSDGRAYTKAEFMMAYNDDKQWEKAEQASPAMAGGLCQLLGDLKNKAPPSYVVLRGFAPRPVPTGISSFVTQRIVKASPELAKNAECIEVSRGKDEVKLQPKGGYEVAQRLVTLVNVNKDLLPKLFPQLTAELLTEGIKTEADVDRDLQENQGGAFGAPPMGGFGMPPTGMPPMGVQGAGMMPPLNAFGTMGNSKATVSASTCTMITGFGANMPDTAGLGDFARRLAKHAPEVAEHAQCEEVLRYGFAAVTLRWKHKAAAEALVSMINHHGAYDTSLGSLRAEIVKDPGVPGKPCPTVEDVERRFDRQCPDGKVYSKEEFMATYGGTTEWDAAPGLNDRRIDPTDGNAYTFIEFKSAYGGTDQWDNATPVPSSTMPRMATPGVPQVDVDEDEAPAPVPPEQAR